MALQGNNGFCYEKDHVVVGEKTAFYNRYDSPCTLDLDDILYGSRQLSVQDMEIVQKRVMFAEGVFFQDDDCAVVNARNELAACAKALRDAIFTFLSERISNEDYMVIAYTNYVVVKNTLRSLDVAWDELQSNGIYYEKANKVWCKDAIDYYVRNIMIAMYPMAEGFVHAHMHSDSEMMVDLMDSLEGRFADMIPHGEAIVFDADLLNKSIALVAQLESLNITSDAAYLRARNQFIHVLHAFIDTSLKASVDKNLKYCKINCSDDARETRTLLQQNATYVRRVLSGESLEMLRESYRDGDCDCCSYEESCDNKYHMMSLYQHAAYGVMLAAARCIGQGILS